MLGRVGGISAIAALREGANTSAARFQHLLHMQWHSFIGGIRIETLSRADRIQTFGLFLRFQLPLVSDAEGGYRYQQKERNEYPFHSERLFRRAAAEALPAFFAIRRRSAADMVFSLAFPPFLPSSERYSDKAALFICKS